MLVRGAATQLLLIPHPSQRRPAPRLAPCLLAVVVIDQQPGLFAGCSCWAQPKQVCEVN